MMTKTTKISAVAITLFLLGTSGSFADERFKPITDRVVANECSACHLAYQPQMLPKRSWEKIMADLSDHFGEDASLDKETAQHIKAYLVANAADASWWGGKFLRGIEDNETPLRITETPHWIHEHNEEVPARVWADPKIKSKANCAACHSRAKNGNYDDD